MKIIPSFKPAISYGQLNSVLSQLFFNNIPKDSIGSFEQEFARYVGVKHATAFPSGRWGLYHTLLSLNLNKHDEIIIPAFTYFAVPSVIVKLGLKPVFVDINRQNLNIDPKKIKDSITGRTKAIIPAHLCGFACNIEEITDIAKEYNIRIIEDCAQSLGAEFKHKKLGSFGEAGYFTFNVTKNFTTLGGCTVTTNSDELAEAIRNHAEDIQLLGQRALLLRLLKAYIMKLATSAVFFPAVYTIIRIFLDFGIDIVGILFSEGKSSRINQLNNDNLNNIQAALGIAQLLQVDRNNALRIDLGLELYRTLKDASGVQVPSLDENAKNIFSTCPILVKNKKEMRKKLIRKGIDVSAGYMQDCSRLDLFKEFKKDCPNASKAEDSVLYIPIYPGLTRSGLRYISEAIKQA